MLLGIDLGTSALKIVAVDDDGKTVASSSVEIMTESPRPGWSEQDPAAWLRALHVAMYLLLANPKVKASRIAGIGLSGQMHGAVLLDGSANVLRPCILWNDSRSHEDCSRMEEQVPDIGMLAGVPPLPGFTAPKIMWVEREEPDIHERIAHLVLPKDFVGHFLHGELVTDASDAAGTLWLDQKARAWSQKLCEASCTEVSWLPPILDGHEIAGRLQPGAARSLGLPTGIPVAVGGGDAATGAVSLGATNEGIGFVALGTSGQLFLTTGGYRPNPKRLVHAFAHTVPDRWYQMAAMLNGARPLSWLAGILNCRAADVVASAESAESDRVPLFLPYLTGERSPHGDPHIRGAFYGLEDSSDRAAICRSVVEAIAFSFADAADSFGTGILDVPRLLAIGGGSRSELLLQTISDATGKQICRSNFTEGGPAAGAARLAAVGTGIMQLGDLARQPEVADVFNPRNDPELQARLAGFRSLYAALKGKF